MRTTISRFLIAAIMVGPITMFAAPASTLPIVPKPRPVDLRFKYTNGCTFVPDVTPLIDFVRSCNLHDICYARYENGRHEYGSNEVGRAKCDTLFLGRMYNACKERVWHEVPGCLSVAKAYHNGVVLFGGPYYYDYNTQW